MNNKQKVIDRVMKELAVEDRRKRKRAEREYDHLSKTIYDEDDLVYEIVEKLTVR